MRKRVFMIWAIVAVLLSLAGCQGLAPVTDAPPSRTGVQASVHFIDVGQGDSILIVSGDTEVLIDAGERQYGDDVVAYLQAQGVKDLELVISTHPHADHIGGLTQVLQAMPVKRVIDAGVAQTSQTYIDYLALIDEQNIPFETPNGQSIALSAGVRLDIIGPVAAYADLNNASVVAKLTAGEVSVLFTGDMEAKAEADLLAAADLTAEVLKVGHHGSDTSSSAAFLAEVKPQTAIISVGAGNSYRHPAPETLEKLSGLDVYRTDLNGTVVVTIDAGGYRVDCQRPTPSTGEASQPPVTVYITDKGAKYHLAGCRYLSAAPTAISLPAAIAGGYEPCGVCKPPSP